jgi:hypothetical protein
VDWTSLIFPVQAGERQGPEDGRVRPRAYETAAFVVPEYVFPRMTGPAWRCYRSLREPAKGGAG